MEKPIYTPTSPISASSPEDKLNDIARKGIKEIEEKLEKERKEREKAEREKQKGSKQSPFLPDPTKVIPPNKRGNA